MGILEHFWNEVMPTSTNNLLNVSAKSSAFYHVGNTWRFFLDMSGIVKQHSRKLTMSKYGRLSL